MTALVKVFRMLKQRFRRIAAPIVALTGEILLKILFNS